MLSVPGTPSAQRRWLAAFALVATLATPLPGGAQATATAPPAAAAASVPLAECDAFVHAARVGPGEYAVETEVTVPLDEVDVRIDGLAGHWIYNPGAPHAVLVVPDERDAIGISVVGTARNGKTATACGPSVGDLATGAAAAKIVADVGSSPQALSPFDYGVDDPPTCAHPFLTTGTVRAGLAEMPSPPASGIVGVKVELDEHSTIVGASVWSTTNAYLNAGALVTARASTFQTQVWRCIPTKSSYLFTVDYYVR